MKQKIIKALKNPVSWVIISGMLSIVGVNLPPQVMNVIAPAVISIIEDGK